MGQKQNNTVHWIIPRAAGERGAPAVCGAAILSHTSDGLEDITNEWQCIYIYIYIRSTYFFFQVIEVTKYHKILRY